MRQQSIQREFEDDQVEQISGVSPINLNSFDAKNQLSKPRKQEPVSANTVGLKQEASDELLSDGSPMRIPSSKQDNKIVYEAIAIRPDKIKLKLVDQRSALVSPQSNISISQNDDDSYVQEAIENNLKLLADGIRFDDEKKKDKQARGPQSLQSIEEEVESFLAMDGQRQRTARTERD